MGKLVSVIAKTPEEHGLSLDMLLSALSAIKTDVPDANSLTVIVVDENASYTVNEVSIDENFVRLIVNYDAPAVHPDK
jgi:hypothetical protein